MNKSEDIISPELEAARDDVASMMARARVAQAKIAEYTQEQVDELITAMVWAVAQEERSEEIARFTVEETQLGNYEGSTSRSTARPAPL